MASNFRVVLLVLLFSFMAFQYSTCHPLSKRDSDSDSEDGDEQPFGKGVSTKLSPVKNLICKRDQTIKLFNAHY